MVVFGGYMHKHKEEEKCFDDKLYLYHLGCHVWVSEQLAPSSHKGKLRDVYCILTFLMTKDISLKLHGLQKNEI